MTFKTQREIEVQNADKGTRLVFIVAFIVTVVLIVSLLIAVGTASAGEIPENRAVNAIIGEAEGEGYQGMLAIACAIRNRGHLNGVYGEKAPRVIGKKYNSKTLHLAKQAWKESASKDITKGADHWGSKHVDGAWIKKMQSKGFIKTFEYKSHVFFKHV